MGITTIVTLLRASLPNFDTKIASIILSSLAQQLTTWFSLLLLIYSKSLQKLIRWESIRGILSIAIVTIMVFILITSIEEITPNRQARILNFMRIAIWTIIYYLLIISQRSLEIRKNAELKAAQAQQFALEARISSLREQLSPHFMFNSLNTLSSLISDERAQYFVGQLANVYRYLLDSREQSTVSLNKEIEFTMSYWHIIKERYESAVELNIVLNTDNAMQRIPPLALQTLVENAIKHNIATESRPLKISIHECEDKIIIENNFQPKATQEDSTGVGLYNLAERYRLFFDKEIEIERTEKHFTVKLPIV